MENPFEIILNRLDHLEKLIIELKVEAPKSTYSDDLVSQKEIYKFLKVTEATLIKWRNKRLIPFKKVGGRYLYNKNDVSNAITKNLK